MLHPSLLRRHCPGHGGGGRRRYAPEEPGKEVRRSLRRAARTLEKAMDDLSQRC
ncbi:MAG: hypothetical protein ACLUNZ_09935 [Evtepia sp.]